MPSGRGDDHKALDGKPSTVSQGAAENGAMTHWAETRGRPCFSKWTDSQHIAKQTGEYDR